MNTYRKKAVNVEAVQYKTGMNLPGCTLSTNPVSKEVVCVVHGLVTGPTNLARNGDWIVSESNARYIVHDAEFQKKFQEEFVSTRRR